jgi:hypothetical protein
MLSEFIEIFKTLMNAKQVQTALASVLTVTIWNGYEVAAIPIGSTIEVMGAQKLQFYLNEQLQCSLSTGRNIHQL